MPSRCATVTTLRMPARWATCTGIVLLEWASPCACDTRWLPGEPVGEVRAARPVGRGAGECGPFRDRAHGLTFAYGPGLGHVGEDPSGARRRLVRVAGRVEPCRRLQEAGDGCTL